MPSELKDSHTSSLLSEEVQQRQIGFWKTDGMPDVMVYGSGVINGSRVGDTSLASSPLQNPHTLRRFDVPNLYLNQDQIALAQRPFHNKGNGPNLDINSKITVTGDHYENGLFSSSLSDLFTRKLRLSANNNTMLYGQSVGAAASQSHYKEEEAEPFESLEEIEAQTIGNLLPDDDDLLSGVTDGFDGCKVQPDDAEDLDFFSSVGGMDLGEDPHPHPHGEQPSRTLFVRNIDSNVDNSELKILFEQYGDIHTLYTACKNRGFVMISYYDIRASRRAMQALQNKPLRRRNLDIHYSVPKEATALLQMGSDFPRDISVSGMAVGGGSSSSQVLDDSLHNQLKYNNYHPHSLPDGLTNTMAAAAALNGRMPEQFNRRTSVELNDNVFGPASGSPATHHYMWNHPSQQPMWPNSPSLMNGVGNAAHRNNTFLHMNSNMYNHHHVGSAPSVNPSIWDRRRSFASGESPDASAFHPASLGPHPLDFVPHHNNIFPRPQNIGLVTHHQNHNQNSVMFPTRGQMIPIINSFDSPRTRRNENQPDNKKQFELDLDRIMRGDDKRTTLMIKNIPNKYTSKMLLAAIDERHRGTYDFIYLPIDFKNKCNVGYAFINMTEPSLIVPFYRAFNGKKWEKFNSEKVASLAYGRIQGKPALIAHFQNSSLMNEDKRCRPILFNTDGPNAGDQVPFPMGVNVRSRVGKNRNPTNEESLQDVGNGDGDSSSGSGKDFD